MVLRSTACSSLVLQSTLRQLVLQSTTARTGSLVHSCIRPPKVRVNLICTHGINDGSHPRTAVPNLPDVHLAHPGLVRIVPAKTPVGASVLIPTPPNRPPPPRPAVRRTPSPSTMSLDPSKNQGGGRPPQSQSPQRLPSVSQQRNRSPAARRRRRARNSSESPPRRTRARAQTRHETPVGAAPRQHQEAPVIQVLREQLQQEETPCQLQRAPRQQEIELLQTPTMPDLNAIMHAALSNGLSISLTLNPPTPRQQ